MTTIHTRIEPSPSKPRAIARCPHCSGPLLRFEHDEPARCLACGRPASPPETPEQRTARIVADVRDSLDATPPESVRRGRPPKASQP